MPVGDRPAVAHSSDGSRVTPGRPTGRQVLEVLTRLQLSCDCPQFRSVRAAVPQKSKLRADHIAAIAAAVGQGGVGQLVERNPSRVAGSSARDRRLRSALLIDVGHGGGLYDGGEYRDGCQTAQLSVSSGTMTRWSGLPMALPSVRTTSSPSWAREVIRLDAGASGSG